MATLTQAFNQWSTRPADERFDSLESLHAACLRHSSQARESVRAYHELRVQLEESPEGNKPVLISPNGQTAEFTNWSFGQLCQRIGAPPSYLRELPPELAAQNLNHGLTHMRTDDGEEPNAKILINVNGKVRVNAFTSERYTRIWDSHITSRLLRLVEQNPEWQPAPAAFDGSRGLYASDRDMFAFMVDNNRRIFEKNGNGGLGRGFFVWNSEVGAASFGISTFLYEYVCGNHRVWGASNVTEFRIRHIGSANDRAFAELTGELRRYAEQSAAADVAKIVQCQRFQLGNNRDEVLDRVFGLRIPVLGKKLIGQAFDLAEQRADWYGNPRSVWGLCGGITEIARDLPNADERVALNKAAAKVTELAF